MRRVFLENDLDVVAIQETKIEGEDQTARMVGQFDARYDVCVSHAVGRSGGACLFLKNSIGITVEEVVSREDGRFVYCDFCLLNQKYRVMCIYAPNSEAERRTFFEGISEHLGGERLLVVMGDFNCICAPEDRAVPGRWRDSSGDLWNEIVGEHDLVDVAHCGTGEKGVKFTHFQGNSHARLDRAYVSVELVPACEAYRVDHVSFSDHCLVTFGLGAKKKERPRFKWESWKMNTKLLEDEVFNNMIQRRFESLRKAERKMICAEWESFKQGIKMDAIERSGVLKHEKAREEKQLRETLQLLALEECKSPGLFIEDKINIKNKLHTLNQVTHVVTDAHTVTHGNE